MNSPDDLLELLRRFIDDRDSLEEHEYARLVDAVKASPELGVQLREQLLLDDALSQRLALDRRQFDAQVQQRVADYLRGEEELNLQADELRSLALSHLEHAPARMGTSWSAFIPLALALSLLLVAGFGIWTWQTNQSETLLARVDSVEGRVVVRRLDDHDQYAQDQLPLRQGDRLLVEEDAAITLRWSDGTRVRLEGGSVADLPTTASGKRVHIDEGTLSAVVAKQPAGRPMVFATPHADAIVRGTELYLHVRRDETELEVAEGRVELVERRTNDSQMVAASQSAIATTGEQVAKRNIHWPTSREGVIYLFAGSQRPVLVRSRGLLRPAQLEPLGDGAEFNARGEMEFSGGFCMDALAARDVASQLWASKAFTLEMVLASAVVDDDRPRRLLALESEQATSLAIVQQRERLLLVANVQERPLSTLPMKQAIELGPLPEPGKLTHLVITYGRGRWLARMDDATTQGELEQDFTLGESEATHLVFGGSPGDLNSRWQGRIAGVAIYDRALSVEEIARNVGRFESKPK
jgi:hypothetical protein